MITVQAIGRLTKDPTLKETEIENEKINVCEFTLAYYAGKKKTNFIKITAFRHLANTMFKNFRKGQKVYIFGNLFIPEYDKKRKKQYQPYIVAQNFEFCADRKPEKQEVNESSEDRVIDDEDLFSDEEDDEWGIEYV